MERRLVGRACPLPPAPSLEVTVTLVAALAPTGSETELGVRRHLS